MLKISLSLRNCPKDLSHKVQPSKGYSILGCSENLNLYNKNNKNNQFFSPNTTTNAEPIKIKPQYIRGKLKENENKTKQYDTIENYHRNIKERSFKIMKIDKIPNEPQPDSKALKLFIDGVKHFVLIQGNPTINDIVSPLVLLEFGLIDQLPTKSPSILPLAFNDMMKFDSYIAFDCEYKRIFGSLSINDYKFGKMALKKYSYADDIDSTTCQDILGKICKENSIADYLTEKQFKKFIQYYENEIAIALPKALVSLKTENDFYKKILSHIMESYKSFKKKLYNIKEKDGKNNKNNNNNNNKEEEEKEEEEEEEGKNNNENNKKEEKEEEEEREIRRLSDLSKPHEWYPEARKFKRNIILHVGPTNSGKTYNALKRLMEAETGVYCGPLRLLAHEIYDKMNENGLNPSLFTGQLRIDNPNSTHLSCTIEMVSTDKIVEVAVIDEFQLMSDYDRGQSWTRAILGIPAVELHLCGDNTSIELVRRICKITGDTLTINSYERLSTLEIADQPVNTMSDIKKGDCLITFKKRDVLFYKNFLENQGLKCAVVYGSLPPSTRVKQAKLFNSDDNVDVLIATDAVGMGLNLNIGRVVFATLEKFDGDKIRPLLASEVKQIAGRAGRYGTKFPIGTVTCLDESGLKKISRDWASPNLISDRAALFPTPEQLELFSQLPKYKNLKFSEILTGFLEHMKIDKHYFLGSFDKFFRMSQKTDLSPMSVSDKFIFSYCPVGNLQNEILIYHYTSYASSYSQGQKVPLLLNIEKIHQAEEEFLDSDDANTKYSELLQTFESYFTVTDIYLWLSNYFPNYFLDVKLAIELSEILTSKISFFLEKEVGSKNFFEKDFGKKSKQKYVSRPRSKTKSRIPKYLI
ncbi:hypothetical protein ACTA71_009689 [Dictyostelium dimigraforme]